MIHRLWAPTNGYGPLLAVVIGVMAVFAVTIAVTIRREFTPLEAGLLQAIALALSLAGSFFAGRRSVSRAEQEAMKPWARTAFRQVLTLFRGLSHLGEVVESQRSGLREAAQNEPHAGRLSLDRVDYSYEIVRASLTQLLQTADDVVQTWEDVVPEEVEAVRAQARETDT